MWNSRTPVPALLALVKMSSMVISYAPGSPLLRLNAQNLQRFTQMFVGLMCMFCTRMFVRLICVRNLSDSSENATSAAISRIGSETKTFTVTAVLQLADGNKIGLDDPIGDYVDGVPDGEADFQ